jgi:hypothetical protein
MKQGFKNYNTTLSSEIMDFTNVSIGILLVIMGMIIIFIGNYYSKMIGILHVLIYFMASFVILGGVIFIFFYDKPALI